ncbi:MAG: Kelch repeat-containing protein [Candidatus Bathyarchaeia archaeon]
MPQGKGGLGAVALDGKIYVIAADVNYEYTPSTDAWVAKTPMPTPRSNFGIAVIGNEIFVIGGLIGDNSGTGVNEVYDPATDTWGKKTSMPTPRWLLEANALNDKIYLIGGIGGRNVTEVYDPATDSWSTKASPLTPIDDYASAVLDNKVYIIGGHEGGGMFTNGVQIYDPENDSWSYGQPAPQKVISATAGVTSDALAPERIYVLGVTEYIGIGTNLGEQVPVVINQVFDPENDSWSVGTSPAINRLGMAVAVIEDKLYAIGGYTYESSGIHVTHEPSAINEQYTPLCYGTPTPTASPHSSEFFWTVLIALLVVAVVIAAIAIYLKKHKR